MIIFLFISLAFSFTYNGEEMHYAVLAAGSEGYVNYRHQADVCHAYHVLIDGGMPAENIIVMSVDDAAPSSENPFPGKLYNKPTMGDGDDRKPVDVREGCNIDYTGKHVTKETFLAVLTGDASALPVGTTGPVLKSTKKDNVFVNFVDHGGVNIIAFPNGELKAPQLVSALQTMYDNKMYKNLVFYMEACESGSMFKTLPTDINIYALTASNAKESSWGTYCPPMDVVNGKHMQTCLGDLFSVNWMEQTDKERQHRTLKMNITLERQYRVVKWETNKSHVKQYGDTSFLTDKIDVFEGDASDEELVEEYGDKRQHGDHHQHMKLHSAVDSRDIRLHVFYQRYISAETAEEREEAFQKLNEELGLRERYDLIFAKFQSQFNLFSENFQGETDYACYGNVLNYFKETCDKPREHDYVMKYYGLLHDACSLQSEQEIRNSISSLCDTYRD